MGYFDFPHTRTYESDLGWLIKEVKEILNVYTDFEDRIAQNTSDIATLNTTVEDFISQVEDEVEAMEARVDGAITTMNQTLSAFRTEYEAAFAAQQVAVEQLMSELREYVNESNQALRLYVQSQNQQTITYLDLQLDAMYDYIDSIVLDLTIIDPTTGQPDTLQNVLNKYYDLIRKGAFTAQTFDISLITCTEFDSSNITAYEFDTNGQNILYGDPTYYMYHPATGEFVPVQTVVYYLAELHQLYANTATEYDALLYSATEYDSKDWTAYEYDWQSKTLSA